MKAENLNKLAAQTERLEKMRDIFRDIVCWKNDFGPVKCENECFDCPNYIGYCKMGYDPVSARGDIFQIVCEKLNDITKVLNEVIVQEGGDVK